MTNDLTSPHGNTGAENAAWKDIVAKYARPSMWRALWQIVDTLFP
jgi:omega-6 fatty acid desaturase (delta-12 desaturase)